MNQGPKYYYWLVAMLFTLFFAIFMMSYQHRDVSAEESVFIQIESSKPTCRVTLFADGVRIGSATMDSGDCNISLYKE
tara:strand:- start:1194 stop:1427 length:234 start_codon:yes stop_codon:yes gene_type:complete